MFFGDRKVIRFKSGDVGLNGLFDIGKRGILRLALCDASGQAGALGDPKAIFPAMDEDLSHTFIMSDCEDRLRHPTARES